LSADVHVIAVCGGTGEFSFLTREERLKLTEMAARHAADQGADCLLVLPFYFEGPTLKGCYELR
jgi:dihydrodipicolinate synthase/N-acetylneuraminate lyase